MSLEAARRSLATILICLLGASTAAAQPLYDHLKCHRVSDPLRFAGVVDLEALQPQFSDSGCKLGRAKSFCVPVAKTLVEPPLAPPDIAGQALSDDYVCYKLKCPSRPADEDVTDMSGTRRLRHMRTSRLCVPARKVQTPCGPDLSCDSANEICVSREPIGPSITYSCEAVPAGCDSDRTCACAGASLCQAPFDTCHDTATNTIDCECLACQ
jgi:hypothetical protein